MHIRVFVMLPRHLDAAYWEKCFARGDAPDETPYGYHLAREMGAEVTFSQPTLTTWGLLGLLDRGIKYLLGFDIRHAWRNRTAVFGSDFDIIWTHTEYEHLGIAALKFLSKRKGVPVLAQSIWLIDEWKRFGRLRKVFYGLLMKQAAITTFHSPENRSMAQHLGLHSKTELLRFGISMDSYPLESPRLRFDTRRPIRVLAMGNDRHRDWHTLFAALGQRPEFELRVGSAKWPRSLQADNIRASTITQEEVRAAYAWADCVVVPLTANLHVSGITVILEAVATGVPVVATRAGGLEAYFDEVAIQYVPPKNAEALRAAIHAIAQTPAAALEKALSAQKQLVALDLTTRGFARRHVLLSKQVLPETLRQNQPIPFHSAESP